MIKLVPAAIAAASLLAVPAAIAAHTDSYKVAATLTAKAETPAPSGASGASGSFSGTYVENAKGAVLTWKLTFSGLTGSASAAHIHLGKPGVAGAVLVPLCGPCKSGASGKATNSKTVIASLEGGKTYVNVHTAKNAGGEIRGQIKVSG